MKLCNRLWGVGQRERFPIPKETLDAIRRGSPATDPAFAKQLGYSRLSIRQIRLGQRRAGE
jgi:hypothetical protein